MPPSNSGHPWIAATSNFKTWLIVAVVFNQGNMIWNRQSWEVLKNAQVHEYTFIITSTLKLWVPISDIVNTSTFAVVFYMHFKQCTQQN